ncbi:MAG: prolipoprotein diacylglyceryl transferase [Alphaproteobacteria bacterium]|nr:prolipoprotein diacylglyceryl transferase [Alphaproteobacteria bacterium]
MAINIHPISPVAVDLFGFEIRWYALSYVAAFIIGYYLFKKLSREKNQDSKVRNQKYFDDLLTYVILGTIIGGRLGYVLFYNLSFFITNPIEIFMIWHGGMSFHGGLLGVLAAVFLFAKRNIGDYLRILDIMAVVAPIGVFLGRIANFINMEVMGRATDGSLGIVFIGIKDQTPRHASPLYEAALEGALLFVIMLCLWKFTRLRERAGALSGVAAVGYAIFRIFCEQFREPDAQIGFLTSWGLTMGQLLSGVMLVIGAVLFAVAMRKK